MDEIKVRVHSFGPERALSMVYIDPTTGKKVAKSAGTRDEMEAERRAAVWQDELSRGAYQRPSKLTWQEFRKRVEADKLAPMCQGSRDAYRTSLNCFERLAGPDRLAKVTATLLTRFQTAARAGGMKESTLHHHLRHIKAVLRWAERQGLLAKCPTIEMPKLARGQSRAKGRALGGEEFDRLLAAVPKIRPTDTPAWERILWGLWLSGLRLGEAVALDWEEGPFVLDATGAYPVFYIEAGGQKSRRHEVAPVVPDFGQWILDHTPAAQRTGKVFPMPMCAMRVGKTIRAIGERAGIVVGAREQVTKEGGRIVRTPIKVFASAHDLRRSFCTRWAQKVPAPVLQKLARHSDIRTTQTYYVTLDAKDLTASLWAAHAPAAGNTETLGNILGNTGPKSTRGGGVNRGSKSLRNNGLTSSTP